MSGPPDGPVGSGRMRTGGVLGLLREPRWVRGLALALAVAAVCVVLGHWQWTRRVERLAANAPLHENYDATPVDVSAVLPADGRAVAADDVWTPVRVCGTYDTDATVLVRNRPRDEQTGYEVLVPLVLGDGTALLVDRGWVPAGGSSSRPDAVPTPPAGEVEVVARVRAYEPARRAEVPAGQVASVSRAAVQRAAAGAPALLGGYGLLDHEDPSAAAGAPAVRPDEDEGPHLAYTVQWFAFALTALVVWVVAGRRELENRLAASAGDAAEDPVETGGPDPARPDPTRPGPTRPDLVGSGPGGARTPSPRPAGSRRRRRGEPPRPGSDEAAEDAEDEALRPGSAEASRSR